MSHLFHRVNRLGTYMGMTFFFCKDWEYSKPSGGPTWTAGVIPRGRDGARQDRTASRGPV